MLKADTSFLVSRGVPFSLSTLQSPQWSRLCFPRRIALPVVPTANYVLDELDVRALHLWDGRHLVLIAEEDIDSDFVRAWPPLHTTWKDRRYFAKLLRDIARRLH
jgi:hypothetical protein